MEVLLLLPPSVPLRGWWEGRTDHQEPTGQQIKGRLLDTEDAGYKKIVGIEHNFVITNKVHDAQLFLGIVGQFFDDLKTIMNPHSLNRHTNQNKYKNIS